MNLAPEYGEAAKDPIVYDWEASFIEVVAGEEKPEGQPAETDFYAISPRSYDDEIMATLASNLSILLIDTVLILFYVILVLGKFNAVEQRVRSPNLPRGPTHTTSAKISDFWTASSLAPFGN